MELTDVMLDRMIDREIEQYEIYLEKMAEAEYMREAFEDELIELY